ncbi:hypothetical protein [Denitrovibrio acetiphilus]|nr:hypothetical protein [Denitrovibrio acetiphilus]
MIIGSAKNGCSFNPEKNLRDFVVNEKAIDTSDIDIVIISKEGFERYWWLYRNSYSRIYKSTYEHIQREIYRGFINEKTYAKYKSAELIGKTFHQKQ